jgi:hypothetical protein
MTVSEELAAVCANPITRKNVMADLAKYEPLWTAAEKLTKQAHSDPNIRARLLADPAEAIAEAAGQPLPKGVVVKIMKDAEGQNELVAEMDPQYNGELDNELLEAVSGGKGGGGGNYNIQKSPLYLGF